MSSASYASPQECNEEGAPETLNRLVILLVEGRGTMDSIQTPSPPSLKADLPFYRARNVGVEPCILKVRGIGQVIELEVVQLPAHGWATGCHGQVLTVVRYRDRGWSSLTDRTVKVRPSQTRLQSLTCAKGSGSKDGRCDGGGSAYMHVRMALPGRTVGSIPGVRRERCELGEVRWMSSQREAGAGRV